MGKIYINCSRCGKDLECEELCDVYTSKIDDSFICKDCYKKEKPDYIQQLKQQLDEKDKEIEKLKHLGSHETNMELFKENTKLIIEKRQFAIQELEKVKEDCFNQKELVDFGNVACFMVDIADILEIINNQIKELKGE